MTINEFLKNGGKIDASWTLVSECSDTYTADDADDDIENCDDLAQMSDNTNRYTENQAYEPKSEFFDIYDKHGKLLVQHVDNETGTSFIKQLKHV